MSFMSRTFSSEFLVALVCWLTLDLSSGDSHEAKYTNYSVSATKLFKDFVVTFNRTYVDDATVYSERLLIFKESLLRQAKLNAKEKHLGGTAIYGVNQFSDWTPEEFREFLRRGISHMPELEGISSMSDPCCNIPKINLNLTLVKKVDWAKEGKVTKVKSQGKCGSCWAFTATECIETQWALAGHHLKELSVQEFISCSKPDGCAGGQTYAALSWLQHMGYSLATASKYPYDDTSSPCKTSLLTEPGVKIKCGCCLKNVSEEGVMKPLIALHGPLAVNVDATMWHDYLGGIIQHHCTDTDINHAVQITGYDEETGPVPYWIVRNSWGKTFGDNGYLRIKIGDGLCGINGGPSYVVV